MAEGNSSAVSFQLQAPPRHAPAAGAETLSERPPIAPPRELRKDSLRGLTAMRNGAGAQASMQTLWPPAAAKCDLKAASMQ
jgi:hypothetical protein